MDSNQGQTLDHRLKGCHRLSPGEVLRLALALVDPLGQLTGSLLIHPGRLLLTAEGEGRILPPPADELALPAIVEFPAYASPEEIRGTTPDIRSALYSLGCSLFQALTGSPPFHSSDPREVLHAHLERQPPPPSQLVGGVPEALESVVLDLLAKDPELRIQTPDELRRRLRQAALRMETGPPSPAGAGEPSPAPAATLVPGEAPPMAGAPGGRRPPLRPQPLLTRVSAQGDPPSRGPHGVARAGAAPGVSAAAPAGKKAAPAVPSTDAVSQAASSRAGGPAAPAPGMLPPRATPRAASPREASGSGVPKMPAGAGRTLRGSSFGGRPGKSASKLGPGGARGVPGSKGRLLRGATAAHNRRADSLDDALEEGVEPGRVVPSRRSFVFTITGCVLGLLIGLFLMHKRSTDLDAEGERIKTNLASQSVEALARRKKSFQEERSKKREQLLQVLTNLKKKDPAILEGSLVHNLNQLYDSPQASLFGEELLRVWALGPAGASAGATAGGDDPLAAEFAALKKAAEELHTQGRLAAARDKILERYATFKGRFGSEIDAFQERCENEYVARWEAEKLEIQRLARAGDGDGAIRVLRNVPSYADGAIQREAEGMERSIQLQLAVQASKASQEEGDLNAELGGDAAKTSDGEDLEDLEKELEGGGQDAKEK